MMQERPNGRFWERVFQIVSIFIVPTVTFVLGKIMSYDVLNAETKVRLESVERIQAEARKERGDILVELRSMQQKLTRIETKLEK